MDVTLLSIIFLFTWIMGMIGVIFLAIRNRVQDLLRLCIAALACSYFYTSYAFSDILSFYPVLNIAVKLFTYLAATCTYLHIHKVTSPATGYKIRDLFHFAPFTISLVYALVTGLKSANADLWVSDNSAATIGDRGLLLTVSLVWLLYAYAQSFMLLGIKSISFLAVPYKLTVIKSVSYALTLLVTALFMQKLFGLGMDDNFNLINNCIILFVLVGLGHLLLGKWSDLPRISNLDKKELVLDEKIAGDDHGMPKPSHLTAHRITEYSQLIEQAFKDKPYLRQRFSIGELSRLTNIPVHHLSYFLNSHHGLNFQDFINKKRIDHLISVIEDRQMITLSLEGKAWAVGFKSRTTFFRAFLKFMNQTPSQYFYGRSKKIRKKAG